MLIIIITLLLISFLFAPLGCVTIWKKYAYFTDGLAHAAVLAGVLSAMNILPIYISGMLVSVFFAFLIFFYNSNKILGGNLAIAIASSTTLAIALMMSARDNSAINISNLLIGDILSADINDIIILIILNITAIIFLLFFFKDLIFIILNHDLALLSGVRVKKIELFFLLFLSLSLFFVIKIIGALLASAMLLIPAITARFIAKTPLNMIIFAFFFSILASICAVALAFYADLMLAPLIVLIEAITYFMLFIFSKYAPNFKKA